MSPLREGSHATAAAGRMKRPHQDDIDKALYGRRRGGRIRVAPAEDRTFEGIIFQSVHEMEMWKRFRALERAGVVRNLRRQVRYPLHGVTPKGDKIKVTEYRADIVCEDLEGFTGVYDPKGHKTDFYNIKKKWFEIEYWPLRIVEL